MNDAQRFGQGISFPPRVGSDGRMVCSVGEQNIREMIRVVLITEAGERLRLPRFGGGLRQLLFEPNNAATRHLLQSRIQQALGHWERRIVTESVTVTPDPQDREAVVATIAYQLVATQTRGQTSVVIPLPS